MPKTIPFDVATLKAFTAQCIKARISYLWGGKVPKHGATPGVDFRGVDCSGFVDEALYLASGGTVDLPAGSWYQEEYVRKEGFEASSVEGAKKVDGVVRIAFLPSINGQARHVVLVVDGIIYQSSGRKGVNTCPWGSQGWEKHCAVYVLARPKEQVPPEPQPIKATVKGKEVPAYLLMEDPAPTAVIALRPLANAGLLAIESLNLATGHAVIVAPKSQKKMVALKVIEGNGYVPARELNGYLGALEWDNESKSVVIR